ncbi:MAG TPA: biotin/lipoyl-containing protein [Candidatus Acidoferrales bacterium]|jgi:biotin carboxyl carrier protein|nr:biotin/lipoyl-containing protein [Candidatus Acidoferrales bacterium]
MMKLAIELDGKMRTIEIGSDAMGDGRRLLCTIDGREIEADATEVAPGIYSILIGGASFEVRVERTGAGLRITSAGREYAAQIRDPRQWRRNRSATAEAGGSQRVVAPMPGKVIRVLVKAGEAVEAGKGIVVVEAMKMQNEVRSPKSGRVERVLVSEGQTVSAGDALAIVT